MGGWEWWRNFAAGGGRGISRNEVYIVWVRQMEMIPFLSVLPHACVLSGVKTILKDFPQSSTDRPFYAASFPAFIPTTGRLHRTRKPPFRAAKHRVYGQWRAAPEPVVRRTWQRREIVMFFFKYFFGLFFGDFPKSNTYCSRVSSSDAEIFSMLRIPVFHLFLYTHSCFCSDCFKTSSSVLKPVLFDFVLIFG